MRSKCCKGCEEHTATCRATCIRAAAEDLIRTGEREKRQRDERLDRVYNDYRASKYKGVKK